MTYRFTGLPAGDFERFFGMDDDALLAHGVRRVRADHKPGFPCRVTLRDAEPGETVLLLNHAHLAPPAVYHASGPIFVREGVRETYLDTALPDDMSDRLYSLRAYDASGTLRDAEHRGRRPDDTGARPTLRRPRNGVRPSAPRSPRLLRLPRRS